MRDNRDPQAVGEMMARLRHEHPGIPAGVRAEMVGNHPIPNVDGSSGDREIVVMAGANGQGSTVEEKTVEEALPARCPDCGELLIDCTCS